MSNSRKQAKKRDRTRRSHRRVPAKSAKAARTRGGQSGAGSLSGLSAGERRGLQKIFVTLLHGASEIDDSCDPLTVQMWASAVCGVWYGRDLIGHDVAAVFAGGLIDYVARRGGVDAVRVLRALQGLMDESYSKRAKAAADALVRSGAPEPAWAGTITERAVPTRAMVHLDPVDDDGAALMVEFAGAFGTHTAGVYVDHNLGGAAKDAFVIPDSMDAVVATMRQRTDPDDPDGETEVRPVALEQVCSRWRDALWMTDHMHDPPISDDMRGLRALVAARLADLPQPHAAGDAEPMSESERDDVVASFMASPHARALVAEVMDRGLVEDFAHQILWYSLDYAGGTPLRFSPVMVEIFCCDFAPRKLVADLVDFEVLPDVLRAWIRFVGDRRGIPSDRIQHALSAVETWEGELLEEVKDTDNWGPAKALVQAMHANGVDPGDEKAMRAFVDRVNAGEVEIDVLRSRP